MACLSVVREGAGATIVASPILVTSPIEGLRTGEKLIFEVLEQDAAGLRPLIGNAYIYALTPPSNFWGKLETLEPCESSHRGLALLRHKPTLRGVLAVFKEASLKQ